MDATQALTHAREIGQAGTLMYALVHAPQTYFQCGDYAAAEAALAELAALAEEKGAAQWKALGMIIQGCIVAVTGRAANASQILVSSIDAYRLTGGELFLPMCLSYLARAYAELGKIDEARQCIDQALTAVEKTKERWHEADVHRAAGEIALAARGPDTTKAQGYFERALVVARQQEAKSWELRAAMSMARLWRDQGKCDEARDLFVPVYGWFTEGFDTLDLKEAKVLLAELRV